MSTVQLLHYREWQGAWRRPAWSIWPITRVALLMLLRRRLFWALYAASLLLFLMFFFGGFLLDWVSTQIPTNIRWGNVEVDTNRLIQALQTGMEVLRGGRETYAYFFLTQGSMVMVVLAFAGSVLVGNDLTFRSVPFYLAKPLTRWHYIAGKCLAVAIVVNLVTTMPALVLFAQHGFGDLQYFTDPYYFGAHGMGGWRLLLAIVGFGAVLSVCLSLILVAVATWMRRTLPLIMIWTTLFMFVRLLSAILVDRFHHDVRWRLIDLWNNMCLVGYGLLGYTETDIRPQPQPNFTEAGLVLGGVCILCLIYLSRRTRAVEVVK